MSGMEYNKKVVNSGNAKVSFNNKYTFDNLIQDYQKTNNNISESSLAKEDGTMDLNLFLEDNITEDYETSEITDSLGYDTTPKEEKGFLEKVGDWFKSAGATVAVAATSVLSGVADIEEAILDGGAWVAAKAVGLFSEEGANAIEAFIARDLVSEANKAFYENTELGKAINDASSLKYDSELAQGIRSVSEDVGVFAISTALTVCTGGAAAPLTIGLGAAHGMGSAAEDTYAIYGTDTSVIQELLIFGNGALSALSWYSSGKLGKGFIEIGKSMAEAGVKEILAEMCKGIFSKEMLKELFAPGNIVGNAIGTLMQAGGDIGLIATKLYNGGEVTPEEWALLIGELITYFGLNIAEDALRTEITNFKAPTSNVGNNIEGKAGQEDLEKTLELPKTPSDPEDTLEIPKITVMDLDDSVGEDLLGFHHKYSIPLDYYYTDEGKKMLDIYDKLKEMSFDEFNSRFTGVFSDEDSYFEALDEIISSKRRCIILTIMDNEKLTSPEQFKDIQDFIFNRDSYSDLNPEMFANFRNLVENEGFTVDKWYVPIYEQLCKKMDLSSADENVRKRLADFTGGYVSSEKTQSIIGSFEFEVDSDFRKKASNPLWAGYNNGKKSVIDLKYSISEIEDIMNHESVHQISHNDHINFDMHTGARISLAGVSRSTYNPKAKKWVKDREGINESITEYFNIISHGEGYKKSFTSGYQPGVDAIESFVDNGLISLDDLKKFYFSNNGEGLIDYFNNLSKKYNLSMEGSEIMDAFDQAALSEGDTKKGVKALNKYLKEYLTSTSSTVSSIKNTTSLFERLKGLIGY